jgi:hypothetical protein
VALRAPVPLAEPSAGFSPGSPDQLLDAERHPSTWVDSTVESTRSAN